MSTDLQLGPRIRALRQARRLTLRDVADRAGVTESFLSQVERDVTSPSIATVHRIAGALDLSIAQLFADEPSPGRVVRREARRRIAYPGLKAVDEFLTSNMAGRLQVILSTIEPGGGTGEEPYTHDSDEEVVVVLKGILDLWVGGRALRAARGRRDHVPIAAPALERQPRRGARHGPVLRDATELLSAARFTPARVGAYRCRGEPTGPADQGDVAPESEVWRRLLLGTDPSVVRLRRRHRRIPSPPRCKMCAAPFGPPGGWVLRYFGHARWAKNPKYCEGCFRTLLANHGGAEVDCSLLFADVRGSTSLAERMRPAEFRALMGRFYDEAFAALIDFNAIVDKFVGDEVIGIFIPAYTGREHARHAIEAAHRLLEVTGHGRARIRGSRSASASTPVSRSSVRWARGPTRS